MIPKIIHYCWFGRGTKNQKIQDYIAGWHKLMPEYQIIEWNEDNFDIHSTLWTEQAYEAKKWAFVSDYVRLYALYTCGGLYFDTDVEVLRQLDEFLDNKVFTGFESKDSPITAVMGAESGNPIIGELLAFYRDRPFVKEAGGFETLPNTYIITDYFEKLGVIKNGKEQVCHGLHIYPQICFCPNNITRIWEKSSPKSYTIHHFEQSWRNEKRNTQSFPGRVRRYLVGVFRNRLGTERSYELNQKIKKCLSRKK